MLAYQACHNNPKLGVLHYAPVEVGERRWDLSIGVLIASSFVVAFEV